MMISGIDVSGFQPVDAIQKEDEEENILLRAMSAKAKTYISGFSWSREISAAYLADGVGGVAAVFLFVFSEPVGGSNNVLWVVVGDLPSAYLVTDQIKTPDDAFQVYCELMEDWANAVIGGGGLKDVFPVEAEPTLENAEALLRRTAFIRNNLMS